eukprot:CAMPEP_0174908882 /NCGR_PEP_ID=MMETSP0167-20121228/66137_1 /TAXON_ID=38298 /ORGANISM="Rhodella maculata, Strain CCMP736" /LENGTH=52 /DNA_ID=CAMNT_0016152729 /DNA_START=54 /DNA_END=208 /DNA_ORIENTATION=-
MVADSCEEEAVDVEGTTAPRGYGGDVEEANGGPGRVRLLTRISGGSEEDAGP